MSQKNLILTFSVIISAIGIVFVASNFSITPSTTVVAENDGSVLGLEYNAIQCTYINGELWECSKNLFTNAGRNATRDALLTGGLAAFDDIAIGNETGACGAIGINDTTLCGEYLAVCNLDRTNAANTFTRIESGNGTNPGATGNWTIGAEFTANAACDVNSTGLFNATSSGTMLAENTFTTASLSANDKVNVTWYIWVN